MNETDFIEQFALCLDNADYEASLELGKLYEVVVDEQADLHGYIRIVDESGEDYAYGRERFHQVLTH